jgi:signal transduction histidine kinase
MGAMADEKSRLEAILETMTNGVIAVTREGGLLHINPMAAKMLDLSSIGEAEVAAALENLALGSLEALADRSSSTAIRDKARTVVLGARSLRLHVAPIESNTGGVPAGAASL